jgi:hypothetical protein
MPLKNNVFLQVKNKPHVNCNVCAFLLRLDSRREREDCTSLLPHVFSCDICMKFMTILWRPSPPLPITTVRYTQYIRGALGHSSAQKIRENVNKVSTQNTCFTHR